MTIGTRITNQMTATHTLAGIQMNQTKLSRLQAQLSSGKVMTKPSDDPAAAQSALALRSELARMTQYTRNADDGKAWLGTIDQSLANAVEDIHRVRDLAVQGMSTGQADDGARSAIAAEVDTLRSALISVANTTYLNRPVFGGTTSGKTAFDGSGSYVGDSGTVNRTVADGIEVRVDGDATATFGSGSTQLFTVLAQLSTDLRSNTDGIGADLDNLDTAANAMGSAQADIGARYNRVDRAGQTADTHLDELKSQLSGVEDIDLPQTIVNLQLQQVAYQAALSATAKLQQMSLVDFLH